MHLSLAIPTATFPAELAVPAEETFRLGVEGPGVARVAVGAGQDLKVVERKTQGSKSGAGKGDKGARIGFAIKEWMVIIGKYTSREGEGQEPDNKKQVGVWSDEEMRQEWRVACDEVRMGAQPGLSLSASFWLSLVLSPSWRRGLFRRPSKKQYMPFGLPG